MKRQPQQAHRRERTKEGKWHGSISYWLYLSFFNFFFFIVWQQSQVQLPKLKVGGFDGNFAEMGVQVPFKSLTIDILCSKKKKKKKSFTTALNSAYHPSCCYNRQTILCI